MGLYIHIPIPWHPLQDRCYSYREVPPCSALHDLTPLHGGGGHTNTLEVSSIYKTVWIENRSLASSRPKSRGMHERMSILT